MRFAAKHRRKERIFSGRYETRKENVHFWRSCQIILPIFSSSLASIRRDIFSWKRKKFLSKNGFSGVDAARWPAIESVKLGKFSLRFLLPSASSVRCFPPPSPSTTHHPKNNSRRILPQNLTPSGVKKKIQEKSVFSMVARNTPVQNKGVNLVVKSKGQFREGPPRRQPRGQPKGPKSWPFGVSECGRFSEILIKKMVFCRREESDCAVEDKEGFSTHSNRGFAVSRAEKDQKN